MTEWLSRVFAGRPWFEILRDVCDVIAVAFVIYRALLVVRGTRAMQMGVGLLVILLLYLAAKLFALVTLLNLLGYLLSSIILIVVVVFQNDIRRALIRVGGQAWLGRGRKQEQSRVIDEVVAAVTELARHRIGAIIAFEQDANLLEFTKSEGTVVGAAVTRELLVAMFYPESVNKLHDGAVLIRDLKIARAGVFFPMPDTKMLDKSLGSRHRAALGITEETDAVVVVVSEERGIISFCFNGNIVANLDGTALRQTLIGLLGQKNQKTPRLPSRVPPVRVDGASKSHAGRPEKDTPPSERPSLFPPPRSSPAAHGRTTLTSSHDVHVDDIHETRPSLGVSRRMPRSTMSPTATPLPRDTGEPRKAPTEPTAGHDGPPSSDRPPVSERPPITQRPSLEIPPPAPVPASTFVPKTSPGTTGGGTEAAPSSDARPSGEES